MTMYSASTVSITSFTPIIHGCKHNAKSLFHKYDIIIYGLYIIINVLIKVTLNEIRCRGTLQSWRVVDANRQHESKS